MSEEILLELGRQLEAYCAQPRCGLTKGNTFKLVALELNPEHTRFNLFDPAGGNCGMVTIRTENLHAFTAMNWKGKVDWKGKK